MKQVTDYAEGLEYTRITTIKTRLTLKNVYKWLRDNGRNGILPSQRKAAWEVFKSLVRKHKDRIFNSHTVQWKIIQNGYGQVKRIDYQNTSGKSFTLTFDEVMAILSTIPELQ